MFKNFFKAVVFRPFASSLTKRPSIIFAEERKLPSLARTESFETLNSLKVYLQRLIEKGQDIYLNTCSTLFNLLLIEGGFRCSYSPLHTAGGHIGGEFFPYERRYQEERDVVAKMARRQALRARKSSEDKSSNPIIALPSSPGSGKSTFLVHFPSSTAYQEYCMGLTSEDDPKIPPVVSTLTFNSGMTDYFPGDFGLRIIYGAAKAMGLFEAENVNWDFFCDRFSSTTASLTAKKAIVLLQSVFSCTKNTRMLVLVDEISKAYDSQSVMNEIGSILDKFENVDVIVSAGTISSVHRITPDG